MDFTFLAFSSYPFRFQNIDPLLQLGNSFLFPGILRQDLFLIRFGFVGLVVIRFCLFELEGEIDLLVFQLLNSRIF
jgi:hypothetical protein